jgi:hypothetical protein
MSGTTTRVDHTNDEILIHEVSDEALETAAESGHRLASHPTPFGVLVRHGTMSSSSRFGRRQ